MDWSNERYVRVYIRDTTTWLKLRWEGQVLFMMMIRKCDRSGIFDSIDDPVEDLSLVTGLPEDHVKPGYDRLIKHGVIELREGTIIIPNFIEAQEAKKSDAQRQRESREKRRLAAQSKDVTNRDEKSQPVTPCHDESRLVTPSLAVPSRTVLNSTVPKKEKTKAKKKSLYPDDFESFWQSWPGPNRTGKQDALRAWKKAEKNGMPPADKLILILINQDLTRKRIAAAGGFLPPWKLPATWLNKGCWDDEIRSGGAPPPQQPKSQYEKNMDLLDRIIAEEDEKDQQQPVKVPGKTEVVG